MLEENDIGVAEEQLRILPHLEQRGYMVLQMQMIRLS